MNELPLFYKTITPFNQEQHGKLRFSERAPDYEFASQANVIPLLVNEVGNAVRHFALAFVPSKEGQQPVLVALVSKGDNVNCFVGANKQWRDYTYIPAYVRQYPFYSLRTPDGKGTILGIDSSFGWIDSTDGSPFVDADGKPTTRLEQLLAFTREFQMFAEHTNNTVKALQDAGVLEEGLLSIEPPGGEVKHVNGFLTVSASKLNSLADESVLQLHKSGALALAYAQLFSLNNLGNLIEPALNGDNVTK